MQEAPARRHSSSVPCPWEHDGEFKQPGGGAQEMLHFGPGASLRIPQKRRLRRAIALTSEPNQSPFGAFPKSKPRAFGLELPQVAAELREQEGHLMRALRLAQEMRELQAHHLAVAQRGP